MTASKLVKRLDRKPFEPFRICVSSGESYDVLNPQMVALAKSRVFIALPNADRPALVSYLHIAALETLSNGHSRRGRGPRRRR